MAFVSKLTEKARAFLADAIKKDPRAKAPQLHKMLEDHKWFGGTPQNQQYVGSAATSIRARLGLSKKRRKKDNVAEETEAAPKPSPKNGRRKTVIVPPPVQDNLCFCPRCGLDLNAIREIMRVAATMPARI